ncbi:putative disease resistance protein At1g50180 [Coffea eugenioides]|uniref:putative disease resistance protein At1g50180 n=1 Tax=Coffea eugenioides TaxID=49369 RepID=UPI000F60A39B|nr:putative disease resistance protein At1g50180 [Coffea eugenioides]
MADPVISLVIGRIVDLLNKNSVFLKDVERQVEKLKVDLVWMRCFLKDAEQRQDEDARIRNWVSLVRAAAYDAEDVIEIFASKVESIKDKGFVTRLAYYPWRNVSLNKIGKEIESLQTRLDDIAASREKFGIKNLGEGTSTHGEELQRIRRSVEDKDIVGFEEKTKSLVAELLKEDKNRRLVSIVGMGGAGKTTLAKKVYNHADVRTRFDCRAWVCVSSSYNHKETLRTIIKQLNPITNELLDMLEKMQEQDLEERLRQDLQDKRYLVVLDDVWKEEAWDCLAGAFPDVNASSRLLLTSRNREVAQHADALSHPCELKTLGEEDSWQLFLKMALGHGANAGCPPDLEEVGREITRRCDGLPLAITVIGGLLVAKKKLKSEWEKVLNNFSTYLSRSQSFCFINVPLKIEGLRNLQTLSRIRFDDIMHNKMITLTSLQKLGIWVDERSDIDKLCMHLSEVGSLKTLHLYYYDGSDWPALGGLSKLHHVTELKLSGRALRMLPPDFPPNLSRLSLELRLLEDDPMPVLEKLGQLSFLKITGYGYLGRQLAISRHGFHQLKFLELSDLNLGEIKVEKGALPQLQCLRIRYCFKLKKLPEELKHISTLDTLELVGMREDFISGLDADLVSSVPNLRIF